VTAVRYADLLGRSLRAAWTSAPGQDHARRKH
jgi:hypothetical protein